MHLLLVGTLIVTGAASRYDPGVFETVSANRQMPPWDGAHVAMLDCDRVGSFVVVCGGDTCFPARVTDCAGVADGGADWMIRGGYAAELDFESATTHGLVGAQIRIFESCPPIEWF